MADPCSKAITMKKCCMLFASLLLTVQLSSQARITGQVFDEAGEAVFYGNVLLLSAQDTQLIRGTLTEEDGTFELNRIPTGDYLVAADALGYGTAYSTSFSLAADQQVELPAFQLQVTATALNEVTVTARKPLFQQQLDRLIVNVRESPTNVGGTALEVLERSPGITVDRVNQRIALNGRDGVVIMINDRPERMDQSAVIQMLAGMPAANIDRIELISTPPANFDAEGDAGVINIILIDEQEDGWNGSWTTSGGYGRKGKWATSGQFFWRRGPWRWYGNAGTNSDYSQENLQITRSNLLQGQLVDTKLDSRRPAYIGFHSVRTGLDYNLNEKTELGVLVAAHLSEWTLDATTFSENKINGVLQSSSVLLSDEINNWTHWMSSLSARHQFNEASSLRFTTDYLYYFDNNPTDYTDRITTWPQGLEQQQVFRSGKETPVTFWVTALDFEHEQSETFQWQAGLKSSVSRFTNKVALDYFIDNEWSSDENFSDWFDLNEEIFAAYWTGELQWDDRWQIKLGGRYEWIDSRRHSRRDGLLPGQRYGRLFPTVFLSYQLSEQQRLGLSYSERITRPSFSILAPAFFFFGPNTILAGNPGVRQTITRQLKADYQWGVMNWSLQWSDDIDPIYWGQPMVDPATNLAVIRAENMADRQQAMLSVNFPLEPTSWWTIRTQAAAYWQHMEPFVEGQPIVREDQFFSGNMTHSITWPKDISMELTGRFHSPLSYGLGRTPWRHAVDFGIQHSFGDGQHRLSFSWNDIFRTHNFWQTTIDDPRAGLEYQFRYNLEGSVMRLSYTWQFGQRDLEGKRERQSASSEEQGRVN